MPRSTQVTSRVLDHIFGRRIRESLTTENISMLNEYFDVSEISLKEGGGGNPSTLLYKPNLLTVFHNFGGG